MDKQGRPSGVTPAGFESSNPRFQFQFLPLGTRFNSPESLFPHVKNGDNKSTYLGASLVAQWLRICLPIQGTRVQALVQEDPTCRGATKPMRHNY